MSRQNVEILVPLQLPAAEARDEALRVLEGVAKGTHPYEHVMLTMGMRDLHIPLEGVLSVPVAASVEPRPMRWECRLQLEAEHNRQLFPRFDGTLTITPNGAHESELWLQGSYEPPLGAFGIGADATLLHGAAENSLRGFLTWLGAEVTRLVETHERDAMHAARRMHP